ncbi:MAG TPA: hypothetical protein VIW03_10210, partial [Anaeromyxobacter sp.]
AGRITFKSPVPGFDAELNPVSVRVTYDVEWGGDPFWVSGVEGGVKLGSALEVGGTYVDDHDPSRPSELRGAYLGARLDPATKLIGEFARTNALGGASGDAGRFELDHESPDVRARVFATATDTAFVNPGAGFGPGRIESGGRLELRFSPLDQLRAEALYSSDVAGDRRRGGGLVAYDRTLHERLRGELGLRIAGETARAGAVDPTSVALRGQLQAQLPSNPDFSANAEYEQSVIDARRMAALGAEYRLPGIGRVYGRHEFLSSLTSPYALSNDQQRLATVFGVDADVAHDQHVYGEYRLGNSLARREAEAALGLRNVWRLDNGLRVGTSFERVNPLEGSADGPTTAFTGSVDYAEREDWKGSYRSEVRTNRAADSYLSTAAAACRIDSSWTALGRNLLSMTDERQGRGSAREWIQLGFAYRPQRSSGWDALGRYELHFDREATGDGPNRRRIAHVLSLHGTGRLGESFEGSGSWAYKFARDRAGLVESGLGMQRISARARTDIGRNWDAGAQASTLVGGGAARWSLGLEGGRQLGGGVWLSAGWNGFGYQDPDFTESEW